MTYKNNYQRKQAVWREKWLKKEEKRLMQRDWKRLKKDVANYATTFEEAYQIIHDAILEIVSSAGDAVQKAWSELTR